MARKRKRSLSSSFGKRASLSEEFDPDYTYIVKDLRRIGILAGSFFTILVILSFVLR